MVGRTVGAVALAFVVPAIGSCCHRRCEPPASAAVPVAEAEPADSPFVGNRKAGERGLAEAETSVRITVLDAEGNPVPAARVQARRANVESPSRRMRGGSAAGLPWHESDEDGVAVLGRLAPGATYHLSVGAPRDRPDLRDAPVVTAWRPRDETVRLRRWRVIRGVVRDLDGRAVVGATVSTKERVEGGWRGASTDETGRFGLERIPDGTIALEVSLHHGLLTRASEGAQRPIGAARVTAGDEEVVLVVDVGKELVVRLEEPDARPSADPVAPKAEFDAVARLWLPADGRDGALASAEAFVRHGIARFRGLRADERYTLWVSPSKQGDIVYEAGVHPGELRVLRRPGKPITVNVRAPATATEVSATVRGPYIEFDSARRSPPGPVEVRGVPEGTWRVWAWAHVADEFWSGWGTATAGSSVDVEVKPHRPPP